jgi:serine/threonine protein kinase
MLQPNPSFRITAKDALEHEYFNDLSEDVKNMYKK